MKKLLYLVLVAVLLGTIVTLAIAQDPKTPMKKTETAEKAGMWNKEMGGQAGMTGEHSMCGMMMSSMIGQCMVASGDGGVIVMAGGSLQKYDSNLKMVKDVEIAYDWQRMNTMLADVSKMCREHESTMRGEMMQGNEMREGMMHGGSMQKDGTNTGKK